MVTDIRVLVNLMTGWHNGPYRWQPTVIKWLWRTLVPPDLKRVCFTFYMGACSTFNCHLLYYPLQLTTSDTKVYVGRKLKFSYSYFAWGRPKLNTTNVTQLRSKSNCRQCLSVFVSVVCVCTHLTVWPTFRMSLDRLCQFVFITVVYVCVCVRECKPTHVCVCVYACICVFAYACVAWSLLARCPSTSPAV